MENVLPNIRTAQITTKTGVDVRDTDMLSGEAKNSLSGTNETTQYTTSGSMGGNGPWGGLNANK